MHRIQLVRWMPRQQLGEMYQAADVLLFPSHEGAGMVVAEAMSYGLPVITLDNEGPGAFLHPQSTLKVPYTTYDKTIKLLADRLIELFFLPDYYQWEKEKAMERFRNAFDWDNRGEQLR